ncbi:unnamed protein product [Closterium sp. NIES-65]|nr:unnamed protein product [Closterium sp. NIES-65]
MPRFNRREQLPLHIKRAICAHHLEHPVLRHVDLARWCFSQYGLRPDRSTIGRILKTAERWDVTSDGANPVRRRAGAWPELEQAMGRWIANAGPAGVPLTLQTIRDHVAAMARNMGIPPTFRCSIGWVRRALRRQGVRCRAAQGEAASADMAAVRDAREKMPRLLTQLGVAPRDTFNLDETALWLSVLPRRTYSSGRIPGRKVSKERLTVAFLVNADGSHAFRPLVISKAKRPHDFRPDYDPEALCYWRHNAKGWMTSPLFTHFITHLNAAMFAEGRKIVVLLDNASSHMLRAVDAWSEIVCGVRTTCMSHVRLVFLPPNTTAFTQPLDQGIIATAKARYRQHWLRAFSGLWNADGATSAVARFRPNLRDVLEWLSESWTSVGARTIQRCWWRTGCLPLSWSLELPHVHDDEPIPAAYPDIELDDDIDDVGTLINTLDLGNAAMTAAEYVAIDDAEPTCAEGTAHPPVTEEEMRSEVELWQAPTTMQAVYDDADPVCREARRTARAACEMLIGYARATRITPRDLCALFDIRNPIIIARMERASPGFNLNVAPQPVPSPGATPTPETPRPRGRVLPDWMTRQSRRQQLLDAGVGAVMDGYVDAAEWMRLVFRLVCCVAMGGQTFPAFQASQQLEWFDKIRNDVEEAGGSSTILPPSLSVFSTALYVMGLCSNDYFVLFFGEKIDDTTLPRISTLSAKQVQAFASGVVAALKGFVEGIYSRGARRFLLFEAPPFGCLPLWRTLQPAEKQGECVSALNAYSQEHNKQLAVAIAGLRKTLKGSEILVVKTYDFLANTFADPVSLGLSETNACCGGPPPINGLVQCGTSKTLGGYKVTVTECSRPQDSLYWDRLHPTEALNREMAKSILLGGKESITPMNVRQLASAASGEKRK